MFFRIRIVLFLKLFTAGMDFHHFPSVFWLFLIVFSVLIYDCKRVAVLGTATHIGFSNSVI